MDNASNTPITAQFIKNRVYFGVFNDKNENLFITEDYSMNNQKTGVEYYWKLTGLFHWALGTSALVCYSGKFLPNFVFIDKTSFNSWLKKFSFEKFPNHEEAIKTICQKASERISEHDFCGDGFRRSYDDAIRVAEFHFKYKEHTYEIIREVKKFLDKCNYKINLFFNKRAHLEMLREDEYNRHEREAITFIQHFLNVSVRWQK